MYRHISFCLVALAFVLVPSCGQVYAERANDPPILPVALSYPPNATVTIVTHASESNVDWDCDWALDCSIGFPAFHFGNALVFGRIDGWSQFGDWIPQPKRHPHRGVDWVTFLNRTGGADGSHAMFHDYRRVMHVLTMRSLPADLAHVQLPADQVGNVLETQMVDQDQDLREYGIAAWFGETEIEAFSAVHPAENAALCDTALHYLEVQVQEAIGLAVQLQS